MPENFIDSFNFQLRAYFKFDCILDKQVLAHNSLKVKQNLNSNKSCLMVSICLILSLQPKITENV